MIITSKFDSKCKACHRWTRVGDQVAWLPGEKGVWCTDCAPDEALSASSPRQAAPAANGPARAVPKGPQLAPPPAVLNGHAPYFKALVALEGAIIEAAELTPELEKAWARYTKLKALAMHPGVPEEGTAALRQALIDAVKLAVR